MKKVVVTVLIANKTNCVKDRAIMRLRGTKCSIMILSGLDGTDRGSLREISGVANGPIGFCGTSVLSHSTLGRVFSGRSVSSYVRFTNLGTMKRSITGP